MNIYGSTEIGADVCYAVLSPPPAGSHNPHLQLQPQHQPYLQHQPHPHSPARHQPHAHRDLATHALSTSNGNVEDRSYILSIPQGDASTSHLKSSPGTSKPDNYSASMCASWLLGNAPVGHPIDGNDLYIVRIKETNNSGESSVEELLLELVADGEPGELFVGGKQLAMGYHNRPADTAERFLSRKVIIGIDSVFQTRVAGRDGEVEEQQQKAKEKEVGQEEAKEDDHHSPLVGAISSVTDPVSGPIHRGKLFRTGDIVVRIPKGSQVRAPEYSARSDTTRRMEEDGDGGEGRGLSDTGGDGGSEEGRDEEAMIVNKRMIDDWAGAIVWLGRRDLQVPCNAI